MATMEEDHDPRKLFVGGISWDTTEKALGDHFAKYGTVTDCVIAKDRISGSPRGFGFVSFSDPSAADQTLLHKHSILGRTVDVKKAKPRTEASKIEQQQNTEWINNIDGSSNSNFRTKKIFVGGLPSDLTDQEFRSYFEKFGQITDVVVMHDNETNRPRGFGFITFENEDSVEAVMQTSFHELAGKLVEVKNAVPKDTSSPNFNNNNYNNSPYYGGPHPYYDPRYSPAAYPGYAYGGPSGYPYGSSFFGGYPNAMFRFGPYHTMYPPYWAGPPIFGYNGVNSGGAGGKFGKFGEEKLQIDDGTSAGGV